MSDSDKDCNGDDNCIECAPEVEVWPVGTGDVIRELAEALRFHIAMWLVNGTDHPIDGQDALARYDRMTGVDA